MKVALVHGFNVRDPRKTIGKLEEVFEQEGIKAYLFHYGWLGLIGVRVGSDNLADAFLSFCEALTDDGQPLVVVGHSNGCALIQRAAWRVDEYGFRQPPFTRAAFLSPALDRDSVLSPAMERVDVFHTKNDWAVRLGRMLLFHQWGDMGACGYKGSDRRYINQDGTHAAASHSGWFTEAGLHFLRYKLVKPLAASFERKPCPEYS